MATLWARTLAIIVAVDMPEALDPTIRNTLVIEQSANPMLVRSTQYAARLIGETSEKEILVHLGLHNTLSSVLTSKLSCPSWHCDDGKGMNTIMGHFADPGLYTFHSKSLRLRTALIKQTPFFFKSRHGKTFIGERSRATCHVHGLSPNNRPMGYRIVVIIKVDWIYDLEWIDQMTQLWPFDSEDLTLHLLTISHC